jgi:sporulation protein YlmC with PRC-barrel domain
MTATHALVDLDDTNLELARIEDDIRGQKVIDRDGEELGKVDGLLIDEADRLVRFLEVGSGGFLGLGKKERLIPVDAVTGLSDAVHVDTTREDVIGSPEYSPELQRQPDYAPYYDYYNYTPYWLPVDRTSDRGPR